MQTFRRLNDPERYYGLSWRGWISVAVGGGVLYLAVRFSPIGTRPTITITVLALALAGTILQAVSGQALGPGRYLLALRPRPLLDTRSPATEPGTWGSQPPHMRLTDVENFARRLPTRANLHQPPNGRNEGSMNAAHLTTVPPYE